MNLHLCHFKHGFTEYIPDREWLIVFCESPLEDSDGITKLINHDDCYLMHQNGYEHFLLRGIEHRSCFAYIGDYNTAFPFRGFVHPSILIVKMDKVSPYRSMKLKRDQCLADFLCGDKNGYREVNLYTIFMNEKERESESEEIEIILEL